jgi:hypothetical protein
MKHKKKMEIEIHEMEKCIKNVTYIPNKTIGYIIESSFTIEEDVYINWNGFRIPLSVKYDISEIWNDIIFMIETIKKGQKKEFTIHFPSSGFFAAWDFMVIDDLLTIKAYWTEIRLSREELYNLRKVDIPIIIDKKSFLEEWNKILIPIRDFIITNNSSTKKISGLKHSFMVIDMPY